MRWLLSRQVCEVYSSEVALEVERGANVPILFSCRIFFWAMYFYIFNS